MQNTNRYDEPFTVHSSAREAARAIAEWYLRSPLPELARDIGAGLGLEAIEADPRFDRSALGRNTVGGFEVISRALNILCEEAAAADYRIATLVEQAGVELHDAHVQAWREHNARQVEPASEVA